MKPLHPFFGALASVLILTSVGTAYAQELDDLLNDRGSSAELEETDQFQETWNQLLDELANRGYEKAQETVDRLQSSRGYISPERRDFIRLAGAVLRFEDSLEADKEAFRGEYRQAVESVVEVERALKGLQLEILDRSRKYTKSNNLPPAVQAGFDKRNRDLKLLLAQRRKTKASMGAEAKTFEATRLFKLTREVSAWIAKDDSEENVVTGLVLSAAFLRLVDDNPKVREQSQRLAAKQEELDKATMIYSAIKKQIEPLVVAGKGKEAEVLLKTLIAKVETSEQTLFVKKVAVAKLRALGITVLSAKSGERDRQAATAVELAEITTRLNFLERKLAAAQDTFGTLIRSIDGLADYTGDFNSETELKATNAKLKEKLKFGAVSKEKFDNIVKARAEHVGILTEVEILQSGVDQLSILQRARLANLFATAQTALALLDEVAE